MSTEHPATGTSSNGVYLPLVWAGSQISQRLLPSTVQPLTAHVKLTENCQAKCISCDYWKSRWKDSLETSRAISLVNEIASLGIRNLRLTGGEPLIRKDFFQVLNQASTSNFKRITLQTNGLLLKRFSSEVNDSPITNISVSIDGMRETNDHIRGIQGYFDLALEGIKALSGKQVALSITLNKLSAAELGEIANLAKNIGADLEFNLLSRSLYFLQNADLTSMWPNGIDTNTITSFLQSVAKRPGYEVDYVKSYYDQDLSKEPPCVLGYLQVFILSNGDVLTGCYPLPPVGNVLKSSLKEIIRSEAYRRQANAMIRRECPGCTCGIESSLAMRNPLSSAFFEIRDSLKPDRRI